MDFLSFFLPGILAILGLKFFKNEGLLNTGLLVAAYYFADAGHVYTTMFRYGFKSKEDFKQIFYPLIIFSVLFYGAFAYSLPYIWTLVIYATFIHNLKQSFGISIWYGKISGENRSRLFKPLFYLLNTVALISFHLRSDFPITDTYPLKYLFFFQSPKILFYLQVFYYFLAFVLIVERFKNGRSLFSITFPLVMTFLYFYSFFLSKSVNEIFVPLILSHGVAYISLIEKSRKVIFNKSCIMGISVVIIIGGLADYYLMEKIIFYSVNILLHHVGRSLVLGALFTHYFLDGILWKRDHPQGSLLYAS
jgi:hypothetical protein